MLCLLAPARTGPHVPACQARYRCYTYLLPLLPEDEACGVTAPRLRALLAPLVGPPLTLTPDP